MRRALLLCALSAALPASAHFHHFEAFLSGFNEVPAVSSHADAVFEARISDDEQSVDYVLSFENLQASVTQAHLHFSKRRVGGPIIVWLCQGAGVTGPSGTQPCPQSGTIRGTFTAANVLASPPTEQLAAGDLAAFIAAMRAGAVYANIHTTASPAGEIRGQLFPIW